MFEGTWMTLTIFLACNNIVFENNNSDDESVPWHEVHGDMNEYAEVVNKIIESV